MDARRIITKIRHHQTPDADELAWFANGLATRKITAAQAGAFAMAVCVNGLSDAGRVALTQGMRDSGDVLAWDLDGPVLDKHSTGGIGDCVSLILAPALAACGVYVPMISGRGLGHTGGTLDKLEAIPGLSTQVSEAKLRRIVTRIGCAIVGATGSIAPADKRLYAIRDVTATVDSLDLITASILSKKLAAGLDGLVLDVKAGSGAFMKTQADAMDLARALVSTANGAGCKTAAIVSDMNTPLAPAMGNAVEVAVCMEVLSGNIAAAPRLYNLIINLGARLLALHGGDEDDAKRRLAHAITSGAAMIRFADMVAALGGPPDMAEDWRTHLPSAKITRDVTAQQAGYITAIDGEALGLAVVALGGGRQVEGDKIDHSVGFSDMIGVGDLVSIGQRLCHIHAARDDAAQTASAAFMDAITIGDVPVKTPLIIARVDP